MRDDDILDLLRDADPARDLPPAEEPDVLWARVEERLDGDVASDLGDDLDPDAVVRLDAPAARRPRRTAPPRPWWRETRTRRAVLAFAIVVGVVAAVVLTVPRPPDPPPVVVDPDPPGFVEDQGASVPGTLVADLEGPLVGGMALVDGRLWGYRLTDPTTAEVVALDAGTGRLLGRVPGSEVGRGERSMHASICAPLVEAAGAVWSADCAGDVLHRIDPASGQVVARVPVAGLSARSLAVADGRVWALADGADCTACQVVAVDPSTDRISDRIPVPAARQPALGAGPAGVWITYPDTGSIRHVDRAAGGVVAEIDLGFAPTHPVVADDVVWAVNVVTGDAAIIDPRRREVLARPELDGTNVEVGIAGEVAFVLLRATDPERGSVRRLMRVDARTGQILDRYDAPGDFQAAALTPNGFYVVEAVVGADVQSRLLLIPLDPDG